MPVFFDGGLPVLSGRPAFCIGLSVPGYLLVVRIGKPQFAKYSKTDVSDGFRLRSVPAGFIGL